MSNEEKLRALLAKARAELQVLASYVDDPETRWPNVGLMMTAKAHKRAVQRIDAALAEPVVRCVSCGDKTYRELLDDNVRVRQERDEARAEVERLKADPMPSFKMLRDVEREAYQRGAEAMREAAAGIFDAPISAPEREVLLAWAGSIRALPVPEDKP